MNSSSDTVHAHLKAADWQTAQRLHTVKFSVTLPLHSKSVSN
jgi:hypothetical protein